jgi:hypothetical protein
MTGTPRKVIVNVVLDPTSNPPKFKFETDLPKGNGKDELMFYNEHHPGLHVHYTLKDPAFGYVFPDKPIPNYLDEALWSTDQAICPTSEGQWEQFTAHKVEDSGKTLVVSNLNENVQQFGYALRVTKDGGQHYWNLDPIGGNQNGSYVARDLSGYAVAAVVGAVAGSLATLGVQALMS